MNIIQSTRDKNRLKVRLVVMD